MMINLGILNGYKTHLLGVFAILVGVAKILSDIPEIEAINVMNITDPWTLVTTGWGMIGARSILSKLEFLNKK